MSGGTAGQGDSRIFWLNRGPRHLLFQYEVLFLCLPGEARLRATGATASAGFGKYRQIAGASRPHGDQVKMPGGSSHLGRLG